MMYAITARERALIDQAIAAGAVRFIPQGVTGIDWKTGRHWPSVEDAIAAHMALVAAKLAKMPAHRPNKSENLPTSDMSQAQGGALRPAEQEGRQRQGRRCLATRHQREGCTAGREAGIPSRETEAN